jgi:LAO/AO transport system kinase
MLAGDRRSLARLFTTLERDPASVAPVMAAVHPRTGRAHVIGITGPPGAGKSTIVDGLLVELRQQDETAGVVAVDPSSTFTGGAVLGDRIRMADHHADSGVFIRSLSTKGVQGGLSRVARASVRLLDAYGFNRVFVESVGVGQTELDIIKASDTVVAVLVPEAGDSVQAMKAGLMEIGDIYVVNKADRDGADRLAMAVESEVQARSNKTAWTPPVLTARADHREGMAELLEAIDRHRHHITEGPELENRRRERRRTELADAVGEAILSALAGLDVDGLLGDVSGRVASGEIDPYTAAAQALASDDVVARLAEALKHAPSGR